MSTQTPNLGLHQWEASDHFLRTEFNEDFAKIDAAVAVRKLLTYTPPEGSTDFTVPLGGADWGKYRRLEIQIGGTDATMRTALITFNGYSADGNYYNNSSPTSSLGAQSYFSTGDYGGGGMLLILFGSGNTLNGVTFSPRNSPKMYLSYVDPALGITIPTLTSMRVKQNGGGTAPTGVTVTVYGYLV